MPTWISISFQDNTSPIIEHILFFHDHAIIILILITILTLYLVTSLSLGGKFNNYIIEGQEIETIWTVVPAFILIFIALPSLNTLYLIEDTKTPSVSINILGHQWYWSYEYTSLNQAETENFMESSHTLRLLNTSELIHLPTNTSIRALATSADVIHSWTLPSIGVNMDVIPGRLNQAFLLSNRLGLFTGQCSEICGINHSFIPILAHFSSPNEFINNVNTV